MSGFEIRRPTDRRDIQVALICALPVESTAVAAIFDGYWENLGKARDDENSYRTGWIGKHNVVLTHLPNMGKVAAAAAGAQLRTSFPNVRLCLVVGLCGGVPTKTDSGQISLGDILVSSGIKQFDLGRHYPDGLEKKDTLDDNLGRPNSEIRSFLHQLKTDQELQQLRTDTVSYLAKICATGHYKGLTRPIASEDKLYLAEYRHKHQDPSTCGVCAECNSLDDPVCQLARESSCADLGCIQIASRKRPAHERDHEDRSKPLIHFGWFASGDTVMKSGIHRDRTARRQGVIGFEMEGAGVWDLIPTIILKSVCDYADSHKNKIWQRYAAIAAATCCKALLNRWSFTYELARPVILDDVPKQASDAEKSKCLQSLAFQEMFTRQYKTRDAAPQTFEWLPKHISYKSWLVQRRGLLWIKGKPGAGKSTLVNYAIEQRKHWQTDEIIISFFCDGTGDPLQKSPIGLFRAILHQILSQIPFLLNQFTLKFRERWETRGRPGIDWQWELKELRTFLRDVVMTAPKAPAIRIFVDALDECGEDYAVQIASYFEELSSSCNPDMRNPSVCFSCRHYPNIRIYQADDLIITLEKENQNDIKRYVETSMKTVFNNKDHAQLLVYDIVDGAQGVFQWVALVVEIVLKLRRYKKNIDLILQRIRETPTDLHNLYHNIFQSISEEDRPSTVRLLQWICFATRPLSVKELNTALIFHKDNPLTSVEECLELAQLSETEEIKEEINRLSGGLVEVQEDQDRQLVRFIHQSVFDYLVKTGLEVLNASKRVIGDGHFQLSRSCLKYLTAKDILDFNNKNNLFETSFCDYADTYWMDHTQVVEKEMISQHDLLSIFQWSTNETTESRKKHAISHYKFLTRRSKFDRQNLLHLASKYGLRSVTESICSGPCFYLEVKDSLGSTAFHYAVSKGHSTIVRKLMDTGQFNVNLVNDFNSETPLQTAVERGDRTVVRILLSNTHIKVNMANASGKTPLFLAVEKGYEEIVHDLLATNLVYIDLSDDEGRTPLAIAVLNGDEDTFHTLLAHGADANVSDSNGRTILSLAAGKGYDRLVRLLLSLDNIEVDSEDIFARTPLLHAVKRNHYTAAQLLLSTEKVEIDKKDHIGRTPLSYAAERYSMIMIKLLLSTNKADPSSRDKWGQTPLSYSAERNYTIATELLRTSKSDIQKPKRASDFLLT